MVETTLKEETKSHKNVSCIYDPGQDIGTGLGHRADLNGGKNFLFAFV